MPEPISAMSAFDPRIFRSQVPSKYTFSCIFDVGANIGQTARRARSAFPDAMIHCFEPTPVAFSELKKNIERFANPTMFLAAQMALGDRPAKARLYLKELHSQTTLVESLNKPLEKLGGESIIVDVSTVHDIVTKRTIQHIDILKMDVEGYELQVLRGAAGLLSHRVSFVIAEVNLSPGDLRQSDFIEIANFLRPFGFEPIGLYDITYRPTDGRLSYCDAVFVNRTAIAGKE